MELLTWWLGLPSSSSHALVGGLIGAAMAKAGPAAVIWGGLGTIGSAIILSPLIGLLLAMLLVLAVSWVAIRSMPFAVDRRFRVLQFISSSLLSLRVSATMRRRRWGSSPSCSIPSMCWTARSTCHFGLSSVARAPWRLAP
jgi:phosphate/sulfate permease